MSKEKKKQERHFTVDGTKFEGFDKRFRPSENVEHVVIVSIDGDIEMFVLESPDKANEFYKYLLNKEEATFEVIGTFSRVPDKGFGFMKIGWEEFERISNTFSLNGYEETEIDGELVAQVTDNKNNVVALWYNKAKVGSHNPKFKGDLIDYAEKDPVWPYGD